MIEVSKSFNVEEWVEKVREKKCCRKIFKTKLNVIMKKSECNGWRQRVREKSKCSLYMKTRAVNRRLLKKPVIREYMKNIDGVSRLKFKFLSGTSGLNEELGRQRGGGEQKWCKYCLEQEGEGVIESVCHLLIQCPNYSGLRKEFFSALNNLDYYDINREWESVNDEGKCAIVLRDFHGEEVKRVYQLRESSGTVSSDRSSDNLSVLIDNYLLRIWNLRNIFIYGSLTVNESHSIVRDGVISYVDLTTN